MTKKQINEGIVRRNVRVIAQEGMVSKGVINARIRDCVQKNPPMKTASSPVPPPIIRSNKED